MTTFAQENKDNCDSSMLKNQVKELVQVWLQLSIQEKEELLDTLLDTKYENDLAKRRRYYYIQDL